MGFTVSSVNMTSAQCIAVPKTRDFEPMNDKKRMFCTKLGGIQHKPGLMGAEASLPQEQGKKSPAPKLNDLNRSEECITSPRLLLMLLVIWGRVMPPSCDQRENYHPSLVILLRAAWYKDRHKATTYTDLHPN